MTTAIENKVELVCPECGAKLEFFRQMHLRTMYWYAQCSRNVSHYRYPKSGGYEHDTEGDLTTALAELQAHHSLRCGVASPATKQLCTMGKGHAGCHKVGGPYHVVEEFVTQCPGNTCEYHHNSRPVPLTHREEEWMECIRCGDKQVFEGAFRKGIAQIGFELTNDHVETNTGTPKELSRFAADVCGPGAVVEACKLLRQGKLVRFAICQHERSNGGPPIVQDIVVFQQRRTSIVACEGGRSPVSYPSHLVIETPQKSKVLSESEAAAGLAWYLVARSHWTFRLKD